METGKKYYEPDTADLKGGLEIFPLTDVVELIRGTNRTGLLVVKHDNEQRQIWFVKGQPIHSETAHLQGTEAYYATFEWKKGHFEFFEGTTTHNTTIHSASEEITIEAVRRLDEWRKYREVIPASYYIVCFATGVGGEAANLELEAHEWKILSLVDDKLDVKALSTNSGFSEFKTTRIVFSLIQAGLLEVRPAPLQLGPTGLIIRPAVREDHERIIAFWRKGDLGTSSKWLETLKSRIGSADDSFLDLVGEYKNRIISILLINRISWDKRNMWWIFHFEVDPQFKNRGVEEHMLSEIERRSKEPAPEIDGFFIQGCPPSFQRLIKGLGYAVYGDVRVFFK